MLYTLTCSPKRLARTGASDFHGLITNRDAVSCLDLGNMGCNGTEKRLEYRLDELVVPPPPTSS